MYLSDITKQRQKQIKTFYNKIVIKKGIVRGGDNDSCVMT